MADSPSVYARALVGKPARWERSTTITACTRPAILLVDVTHALIRVAAHHLSTIIGRPIIYNNNLVRNAALPEHAFDGGGQVARVVVCSDDCRNAGRRFSSCFRILIYYLVPASLGN